MATALFPLQREMLLSYYSNLHQYDLKSARLMREASLTDNVNNKPLIGVLTDVTPKYLKKINDAYSILESIDVDAQEIADFFDSLKNGSFANIKESIPLRNTSSIGTIKPDYLRQVVSDMGRTIDDIMNARKTMKDLMLYVNSNPSTKIKKQMVTSSNPIIDPMDYIKQQERIPLFDVNVNNISREVIPFLRDFPVIKKNLYDEVMSVKTVIQQVAVMLHKYSDTADSIKARGDLDAPTVDCLNYYLYNQFRIMEDLISYITFSLVVKIDNYIFNINAFNDLYRRLQTITGEHTPLQESAYEYSMAGIDLDNLTRRASDGDMSGVIDWTIRAYDAVLSAYNHQNSTYSTIDFVLDRFTNPNFVFDTTMHQLEQFSEAIDRIKPSLRSTYMNPEAALKDTGLMDLEGLVNEAKRISDISFYEMRLQNGNLPYSDILFSIMAEMRQSPDKCERLGKVVKDAYDKSEEFSKYLDESSDIPNEIVKNEMKQLFSEVSANLDNAVRELVENIVMRYQKMEKLCYKLMGMQGEVIECFDGIEHNRDFNVMTFEACIDLDNEISMLMIESEMQLFKELKLRKEYGLYSEAGEPKPTNTNASQPENTTPQNAPQKSEPAVEHPDKVDPKAAEENAQATKNTEENKDENDQNKKEEKKDDGFFKKLIESINSFFTRVLESFTKSINSRFMKDKEFIDKYKDELLNRNCTGLKINMYNYDFNMTGADLLGDIEKVKNVLSQLNETNIDQFNESQLRAKLFNGINLNSGLTDTVTAVQTYYKVGPNETEIKKISYSTASKIKDLIAKMVAFCENFCAKQEYKQMDTNLEGIKKTLEDKIKGMEGKLPEGKEEESKKILKALQQMVLVFSGAILTGYRNRFQHYMYILRKCVVKKEETETNEEGKEPETNNNEGTEKQPEEPTNGNNNQ